MSFPQPILANWTPQLTARLDRSILVGQHRLHESELFQDEALVELLECHPRADLGINTMGSDPTKPREWREGRAGGLSPEELLTAAKRGHIWLNLRRVMDHHPTYRKLVHAIYEELESKCPRLKTFHRSANLLISSPSAMVYFHMDCPVNMLWHLRGTKRVWAYPLEMEILSQETIEAVLAGEKPEEIEYTSAWDYQATLVDLEPGEMITWPQHTPHRVVNTSGLNVSLSTEHMTRQAVRKNNVYLANRHFRRMFHFGFKSTELEGWRPAAKELALRLCRRVPLLAPVPPRGYSYPETFEIDLQSPGCVRILTDERRLQPVTG